MASKLEEHPIRIRDLINVFDYLLQRIRWEDKQDAAERQDGQNVQSTSSLRYKPIDYFAKEFYDFKDDIVIGESQMLKVSSFVHDVVVGSPETSYPAPRLQHNMSKSLRQHCQLPASAWSYRSSASTTASMELCQRYVRRLNSVQTIAAKPRTQPAHATSGNIPRSNHLSRVRVSGLLGLQSSSVTPDGSCTVVCVVRRRR